MRLGDKTVVLGSPQSLVIRWQRGTTLRERMNMSNRERFKAIARFQRPGDLFLLEMVWYETASNWVQQGAPEEMLSGLGDFYGNPFSREYFKLENKKIMSEVQSGWAGGGVPETGHGIAGLGGSPLVPAYESRITAEDERL